MTRWQELLTRLAVWPDPWSRPRVLLPLLGLGLLVLLLLLLRMTRWGQAKTVSKCVVLSVLAHILLLVSACSIDLFFGAPPKPRERILHLSLVSPLEDGAGAGDGPSHKDRGTGVDAPLADVSQDEPLPPAAAPPPVPAEPLPADAAALPPRTPALPPAPDLLVPAADSSVASSRPRDAPAQEKPADAPAAAFATSTDLPDDAPAPLPGPRPADEPRTDLADTSPPGEQRLAELPLPEPPAEALADAKDRPQPTRPDPAHVAPGAVPHPEPAAEWRAVTASMASVSDTRPLASLPPTFRRSGDGGPVPELLRGRLQRERLLAEHGGSARSESSVKAALDWLAANQGADGRWDADRHGAGRETRTLGHDRGGAGAGADTGISGLALLAFLGANYTHLDGPYQPTVQRGLEFLLRSQAADGHLAGAAELFARMYCHGMATLALSEAYAITGDQRLRAAVDRALQYTRRAQNPTDGGWRYQPGDPGDMSQFGWQLLALKSAELAGIPVPAQTRAGMIRFLNLCTTGPHRGLASYRPRQTPSRTMTAEALTCRLLLPVQIALATRQEAVAYLLEERPDSGPINLYYWYYATLGLFQVQGEAWKAWNAALQTRLLEAQESRGTQAGSWPPDTVWGGYGGRVYSTALAALCLEVYYRYLPLYAAEP